MRSFLALALTQAMLVCPLLCGAACGVRDRAANESAPVRKCCARCQTRGKTAASAMRVERRSASGPVRPADPVDGECLLHCVCKGAVKNATVAVETPPPVELPAAADSSSALPPVASPARRDGGPPGRPPDGRALRTAIASLRC